MTIRKPTATHPFAPGLLLATVLLLAGCGERGDVGIFASIEREEKVEKANLPEVSTAGSMIYHQDTDRYYVALGRLYERGRDDTDWDEVDFPSDYDDGHTLDIVALDEDGDDEDEDISGTETVYVAMFDTDSTKAELYRRDVENGSWDGPIWSPDREIAGLVAIDSDADGDDDRLFAVTVASNKLEYDLIYSPGGVGGGTETQVLTADKQVLDGTSDGTSYYLLSSGMLYVGSVGDPSSIEPAWDAENAGPGDYSPDLSGFPSFSGLLYVAGAYGIEDENRLYLTSPKGLIAYSTDAGETWTVEEDDDDRVYTDPAYLDFPGFTGVVLGGDTRGFSDGGYFELEDSSLATARPSGDNYDAADISDAAVQGFFVDTLNNRLFALTNGAGLWSASYDVADPEWRWE